MRYLDFLDGFESSSAPSAGSPTTSKMAEYASDAAFVSAKGSAAAEGDFYKQAGTPDVVRVYMDGAWTSLVSITAVQALTNKTLQDSTTTIVGSADATKAARFEVDGITTGTTRVMTVPNFDGTIATLAGTESLTNKTITTPTISSPVITGYTPTIQSFTSGSGTYTTPANVRWLRVRMVGGGGAGGASGTASWGSVGNGAASTFGTTLLSAGGGTGGAQAGGGAGGTSSLGSGPIGFALTGGVGQGAGITQTPTGATSSPHGPQGGSSAFGGGGAGGLNSSAGGNASTNTGGGGGGAAMGAVATNCYEGAGGGAGGYVDAIINGPAATYPYAVGAGGTGQTAGTSGSAGGNGAAGIIIVEEHYI